MAEQTGEKVGPQEGQIFAAGDLSQVHHGWLVKIPNTGYDPDRPIPGPEHRTITLGGTRHWTYADVDRCGLLDLDSGGRPWRGTEYSLPATAEVTLVRPIKKGIPRARKGDYALSSTPEPTCSGCGATDQACIDSDGGCCDVCRATGGCSHPSEPSSLSPAPQAAEET